MAGKKEEKIALFWMRRDLRLEDNAGLYHALNSESPVLILFIFDTHILSELPKQDARVEFIHDELAKIKSQLEKEASSLLVKVGEPLKVWEDLLREWNIARVVTNRDFEPYAKDRDEAVKKLLAQRDIPFETCLDHLIFAGNDVLKDDGEPYKVFTPYSKSWKAKLSERYGDNGGISLPDYGRKEPEGHFLRTEPLPYPSLESLGFSPTTIKIPEPDLNPGTLREYGQKRDIPAADATSRIGVHLRFGTLSIRKAFRQALKYSETFVNELIWREFYSMILDHYPRVVTESFRPEYDRIRWRNNEKEFSLWCEGMTGFPLVDAGMRQLNETGYMHNRVRMVVASFLTKDLLIDWRWGEQYFAVKLLDYELASNNGGWQWAAGTGTDAAPYFRIFNPESQQKKFDPKGEYIRKWVPEIDSLHYPAPIVDHREARERCLKAYKKALDR